MPMSFSKPFGVLAAACLGLLAGPSFATPISFEPGDPLYYLDLDSSGGELVVAWQHGLTVIDPVTLAMTRLETGNVISLLTHAGDYLLYYHAWPANPNGALKSLRGRQIQVLQQEPFGGIPMGERVLFTTTLPGQDVRVTDGTPAGTFFLLDLMPGWIPSCGIICDPGYNMPSDLHGTPEGRIFFVVSDGPEGVPHHTLYTRDAPAIFPGLPPAPVPEVRSLAAFEDQPEASFLTTGGRLLFAGRSEGVARLFSSDGQVDDLRQLATFFDISAYPAAHHFVEAGGAIFFLVERAGKHELWRTDSTSEAGTSLVHEFAGPLPPELWSSGGRLYLPASTPAAGLELWTSDGTPAGTRIFADLRPGAPGGDPQAFRDLGDGRFAFTADDGVHGPEPWISDGTAAGTRLLEDARPGPLGSEARDFVWMEAASRLFYSGKDAAGRRTPSYAALERVAASCPADQLCLHDGRFRVTVSWTAAGETGAGKRSTASDQTGFFTFFSPDNWEVMIKVLDGCAINQRFWVFAAAATDVRYEIEVKDLWTAQVKTYAFPGGAPAPATADVEAFATCAATAP